MLLSSLGWTSLGILAVGLLSKIPLGVIAQDSSAVCLSQFSWMDNSKSQNPCLIAAYVQSVCSDGQFTVNPLAPDTHYTGPFTDQANPCECSSVTYNLVAACSICQNRTYITWSSWSSNCSTVYPGYPDAIPVGTAIPNWAYQDLTTSDNFNVTLAQAIGDAPESTATKSQATATGLTSTTASASFTALAGTSQSNPTGSTSPNPSKSSNVGAIAGGVVGGVVGLAAIVALSTWCCMRRRRAAPPPAKQMSEQYIQGGVDHKLKLYDPSDPSTFPTSPPPHSGTSFPATTVTHGNNGGGYSGAPEL